MCEVEYAVCPDEVDCNRTSPVIGSIHLELPGIAHTKIQHHCHASVSFVSHYMYAFPLQWLWMCSMWGYKLEKELQS